MSEAKARASTINGNGKVEKGEKGNDDGQATEDTGHGARLFQHTATECV